MSNFIYTYLKSLTIPHSFAHSQEFNICLLVGSLLFLLMLVCFTFDEYAFNKIDNANMSIDKKYAITHVIHIITNCISFITLGLTAWLGFCVLCY